MSLCWIAFVGGSKEKGVQKHENHDINFLLIKAENKREKAKDKKLSRVLRSDFQFLITVLLPQTGEKLLGKAFQIYFRSRAAFRFRASAAPGMFI